MKAIIQVVFVTILLALCSQSSFADEMTPSEETVCDFLQGDEYTNGLFGLCDAYCEAKDCDEYPAGEEPRSCNRILANYDRQREEADNPADPDMPCLAEPSASCPCWTPEQFAARGGSYEAEGCGVAPPEDFVGYLDPNSNMMIVFASTDDPGCVYINDAEGYGIGLPVEGEEIDACATDVALLQSEFNEQGIDCDF